MGSSAKRQASRGARQPGRAGARCHVREKRSAHRRFVRRSLASQGESVYPGGQGQPRFRREQRAGWGGVAPAGSQFPSPSGLRKLKSPPEGRGAHGGTGPPVRADLPRRGGPSAEGPRPLLPGRSLSLSLGRESEARTSGPTGVICLRENLAGKKRERRTTYRHEGASLTDAKERGTNRRSASASLTDVKRRWKAEEGPLVLAFDNSI